MNQNQTTVLIVKNNEIKDIVIPRWGNKFHANGAADVQFTKGYKDGKRVVNIAVQVRDKKTRFQYEGDADDIQLECSRPISLPAFYAIASNRGKFRASKEARSMMMGRFPAYFYKTYAPDGKLYYAVNVVMGTTDQPIYRKFFLNGYYNVVLEKEIDPEFVFEEYVREHDLDERPVEEEQELFGTYHEPESE